MTSGFNNWVRKSNVIIEKLDIKLKRQKIKKKKVRYDYWKKGILIRFKEH